LAAEMHEVLLAPALCHLPGADPERAALRRSEIAIQIRTCAAQRALDPDQENGTVVL
jgi:hypothetical protein